MPGMRIFALTGGIASGKSTVSKHLHRLGAAIVDADRIAHRLAMPHQPLWEAYMNHFGAGILLPDGTLNRRAIGRAIFHDALERKWLDEVSHPLIRSQMEKQLEKHRASGKGAVFLDVPLLYEVGWDAMAEEVWVVYVPFDVQLARLMARDACDEMAARERISSQMSLDEKRRRADFVIDNSGAWNITRRQVEIAWERLGQEKQDEGEVP